MAQTSPIGASAPVFSHADQTGPINLHDLYCQQAECGYVHDLELRSFDVQHIAARLRGISAIAAILRVENGGEDVRLGDWLRSGLIDAIAELATDTESDIDRANDRAAKTAKTH